MNHPSRLEAIFFAALERGTPQERAAYLEEACQGDADLRRQVEKMLAAQAQAGSFLERPGLEPSITIDEPPLPEQPGTIIGPYKLLEQIGEGGFGIVFMAEQQQPIRRKVALKILKPGLDTRQVIARFEAERQALALMEHTNIAHVFDGGATPGGRPYFVMELIKGIPITEFCDQEQFPPRERLELFLHVCQAVQHAHQKGIIHRDLKPSNVLVTLHDGTPVVKVIDFGIAKATGQQLTEKTLFTNFAQLIGTPLYMSPEQAALSGLDVDTRSDIYSLGVLLYELLTGTTPFDKERFRTLGYDEMRRIIREEEPPRPSTRISTLGQAATTASTQRRSDPKRLSQLIRGELDWIVMKALEKNRNRRYETASAFAADVQRYLQDQPVQACPPSAWYRFRKMARRNKSRLAVAAALFFGVTVIAVSICWTLYDQAVEDAQARYDHQVKTISAVERALAEAETLRRHAAQATLPDLNKGFDEAWAAAKRAQALAAEEGHPELARRAADLAVAIAAQRPLLTQAVSQRAMAHNNRGWGLYLKGKPDEAIAEYKVAIRISPNLALARNNLAVALVARGKLDDAIAQCQESLSISNAGGLAYAAHFVQARAFHRKGMLSEAIAEYKEAIRLRSHDCEAYPLFGKALDQKGIMDEAIAHADPVTWRGAGLYLAARAEWTKAAALVAQCIDPQVQKPAALDDSHLYFEHACLRLLVNDAAGHRLICARMLDRADLRPFLVARACTLAPDAAVDLARVERLAQGELQKNQHQHWSMLEQAALDYRAGRYDSARTKLRTCLGVYPNSNLMVLHWLWLAMAEYRLGNQADGRHWLKKVQDWMDGDPKEVSGNKERAINPHLQDWLDGRVGGLHLHVFLEIQVLRREATEMILGTGNELRQ
jgi:serine/threonine protein kinase/Flp pilus assembly protein TadD